MVSEQTPLLPPGPSSATGSAPGSDPAGLPLNIGHRGYKAVFPENSMAAFEGALAAGAHALETDLHLSRDGVVVLSHDLTLKRCFGVNTKIADCDWSYLSTLQSVREPRQPMPRLLDLLTWLARPEADPSVWVLLDIKTDDDPELLLPAIARTIASVPLPGGVKGWKKRVVAGCWNENYINHARLHLPDHPLVLISFSLLYAHRLLSNNDHPDVHFNLSQSSLVGPLGAAFRRAVRAQGRRLYVWTVNEPEWMEWAVRKEVDGVITDEVARLKGVLGGFEGGGDRKGYATRRRSGIGAWPRMVKLYANAFLWQALGFLLTVLMWRRFSGRGKPKGGLRKLRHAPGAA
ncbi:PLC-like phosphodiesterase [Chaetomium sp. MPI-SDFR-AT-0129]|nr:PLC-like phosphodiesterase [Chaetomium sp. MPI-SDFR-AT-0129]